MRKELRQGEEMNRRSVYEGLTTGTFEKSAAGLGENQIWQCAYSDRPQMQEQDYGTIFSLLVLQGIVNRRQPVFYFDHQTYFGKIDYFGNDSPKCTEEFRRFYADTRTFEFLPVKSAAETLKTFVPALNGVILYNEEDMNSVVAAINLASLYDCVPVAQNTYRREYAKLGWKIVGEVDLSEKSLREAYEWMFENILPHCNKNGAYAMGYRYFRSDKKVYPKFYIMGLDYAVLRKNFVFLLSCNERERGFYDYVICGDKEEFSVYEQLLDKLEAPAAMQGWIDPEWRWALTATQHGHFIYCTDWAPNLSFHASVPPLNPPPYEVNRNRKPVKLENKVYISVLANEGDTPKMVAQLYNNGWLDPRRGEYPVNWTINPTHAEHFPSLLEYYVLTAKENDFFSLCPNGAGYNVVRENDRLEEFLEYTRKVNKNLNFRTADLWYANMEKVRQYFRLMPEIKGISIEPHFEVPEGQVFSVDGKTVVRHIDRLYYWYNKGDLCTNCKIDKEKLTQFLNGYYSADKPAFVPIYGFESDLVGEWAQFCDTLDKDKFVLVDMETFFDLASQVAKPFRYDLPEPAVEHEFTDRSLFDKTAWFAYDGKAEFEWVKEGLKVRIPADAEKKSAGFRNDILSSTAQEGQCSAMVAIRGVRLPEKANVLTVTTSYMSEGSDWMFWTYGDYDGFSLTDKWEPFWKLSWAGSRSEEVPGRVRKHYPKAHNLLILCVEGKPGDEIVFSELKFTES